VGQELGPEVVGHEPVVPGEGGPDRRARASRLHRQGGQVQADRPALGPPDELVDVGVGQPDTGALEQGLRLVAVHGQLAGPDLGHLPLRPEQGHRQRRSTSGHEHQLGPSGKVHRQLGHRVQACLVVEHLQVVQDEDNRVRHRRQGGREPGHHGGRGRHAR
jgi:hypothetical protein